MKYIKRREDFIKENKDKIKDDALEILSQNDDNQPTEVKKTLDGLDSVEPGGKVVTRFAPSPTGMAHIGSIRTALYNYLFAKKHNGIFYLRIEDTDQKRFVKGAEKYIEDSLNWVGIEPDYSPWKPGPVPYDKMRQSERDYSGHIKTLLDNGSAYYAFDSDDDILRERESDQYFSYNYENRMRMKNSLSLPKDEVDGLLKNNTPYVIRFKTPANQTVSFNDIIRGNVSMNTNQTDDKVLVKSNGIPTYHLANVCDDHDMGTTHVIRGEEWLPSTPLHILLYESFGWKAPKFAHLPLILNPDGKGKLSKRKALKLGIPAFPMGGEGEDDKGNVVKYVGFKDEGYEPDAVLNFLILLGWSSSDGKELLTMSEMISDFSLSAIHKAGARFDIDKAKYFNQEYLNKHRDDDFILKHMNVGDEYKYSDENMSKIIDLCKKRSVFAKDLQSISDIFFKSVDISKIDKSVFTEPYKQVFSEFVKNPPSVWENEEIKQKIYNITKDLKIKMGKVMPILRISITGGSSGPDLVTTMEILGKEETLKRIQNSL
jgi:nondiscriminating glutamyl-tRNA synthetase